MLRTTKSSREVSCYLSPFQKADLIENARCGSLLSLSRNFRFGFQQPHTILEFLFLKPEAPIQPSWAAACLSRIAHFGSKLLRNPDLPLAQPTTPTPLHLFASSRTDLFDQDR